MQIIYHGSNCEVKEPKIIKGKYAKDFGIGFYCTILSEQAEKWAKKYDTSFINMYEYNENQKLKIKEFTVMTEEWLDFIINGAITREAFWELAKFRHPTHQIAFCTEEALKCIRFVGAKEI